MLPIMLHPTARIGLAGSGEGLERRTAVLREAGIEPVAVGADADSTALQDLSLLLIAGLEEGAAAALARRARAAGVLVNVEDKPALCDFYLPAIVRRGSLTLTVSTNGASPGLARRLRKWLELRFGREWDGRLKRLGEARRGWRAEGASAAEVSRRTRRMVDKEGWLA